jgi:hypothetical protein
VELILYAMDSFHDVLINIWAKDNYLTKKKIYIYFGQECLVGEISTVHIFSSEHLG